MSERELISLKEAAKISGYSADYIGQLIRGGKIPGKQVYSNIAWMTTAEAVLEYKKNGKAKNTSPNVGTRMMNTKRRLQMELGIIKLVFQNFRSALPLTIGVLVLFAALLYSVFYFSSDRSLETDINNSEQNETKELTF